MHIPQYALVLFCFLTPIYFLYFSKNHDAVIAWVGINIVLDIFGSQQYMNLAAILIFGMTALPFLWTNRRVLVENPAVKIFIGYLLLLGLLGIYFGYINPWPDLTGARSFKDQSQMRSLLHFGRTVCEWSAIFYLVIQFETRTRDATQILLKTIFIASIVLCCSALFEIVLGIDFYSFFTGGRELLLPNRPRGFTYEPRGLSQNLAYAILLTPFVPVGKWRFVLIPVFMLFAFAFTVSFTGIAVLCFGLLLLSLAYSLFHRKILTRFRMPILLGTSALVVLLFVLLSSLPNASKYYLRERFNFWGASGIAQKLEVFDAASINFLNNNPAYYFLGTGPGLIYLPASEYILPRDNYIWGNRFEALPHMGLVLLLSNSGFIGLALFVAGFLVAIKSNKGSQSGLFILGLVLTALYFIQIRYFFVFGFAALIARYNLEKREQI